MPQRKNRKARDRLVVDEAGSPERDRDDVRVRIVNAAAEVLFEHGTDGFSMRRLGRHLGTTAMMPYRHFASKEAVFVEVRRLVFDRFADHLEAAVKKGKTAEERFLAICKGYLDFGSARHVEYSLIFDRWDEASYDAVLSADGPDALSMTRSWSLLLECVAELRGAGRDDRATAMYAHLTWIGLHGLVDLAYSRKLGFGMNHDELGAALAEDFMSRIVASANDH